MNNYRGSKVFPIAIMLIVVAVAIAALVSLTRAIFFSGISEPEIIQVDLASDALHKSSVDYAVKMSVRGKIVADENFRSYEVLVTPSGRSLVVYSGYQKARTLSDIKLKNSVVAYEQFALALEKANLIKGEELPQEQNDLRGVCASGNVYVFEVLEKGKPVKGLWSSSCKNSPGSLDASLKQLRGLFLDQIPDGSSIVRTVGL